MFEVAAGDFFWICRSCFVAFSWFGWRSGQTWVGNLHFGAFKKCEYTIVHLIQKLVALSFASSLHVYAFETNVLHGFVPLQMGVSYRDDFDEDDSDQDAYLEKMKAEGAARMDDTDSGTVFCLLCSCYLPGAI